MACPVCYSPSDPVITESLNAGILVLLGITGAVLAGIVAFVVSLVLRAQRAALVEERVAPRTELTQTRRADALASEGC
jgi:hypothetical protein